MDKNKERPNAIEKSLDILMAFVPDNPELGTMEISKQMGLHKATASRILLTLARRGFLKQNPKNKKFRLGKSSLLIGKAVVSSIQNGLVKIAKPYVDELCNDINETIMIEKVIGTTTTLLYVVEGRQRHRITANVGDCLPVYATAGAKAILAFSDPEVTAQILSDIDRFSPVTSNTLTNPQILLNQLETIRRQGVAFDNEEFEIGINAVALPIFNFENKPEAALVVVGPTHRISLTPNTPIIRKAQKAAANISAALMHDRKSQV